MMDWLETLIICTWFLGSVALGVVAFTCADPVMTPDPWPIWVAIAFGVTALLSITTFITWLFR